MRGLLLYKKYFIKAVVLFLFSVGISLVNPVYEAAANNNEWGISFQTPGKKPVIDIGEDILNAYDAHYIGGESEKNVYLTFDAGYENGFTPTILNILQRKNVPAAFFMTGIYIRRNPEIVKQIAEEGYIIGNHSMTHPEKYILEDKEELRNQLALTEAEYLKATGQEMEKYYRPPCGKYTKSSLRAANDLGYKTIFWSLAYHDYDENDQPSEWTAMKRLTTYVHPGAVILLHNMSRTNVNILEELINQYKQMGYTFKRLDELA